MHEPATDRSDEDVLVALVRAFEASEQSTSESRELSERDRDYRNSDQWTDDERAKLTRRGQPVVTIDRIGPKIDTLLGLEQQHRADPKAFPRTQKEEDGAQAATDALRYVMEANRWDRVRSECFDFYVVEGACGVDVHIVDRDGDPQIEVLPIAWDRMWGDEHSRAKNWSDGKVKGQVIWMDLEDAVDRWPDKQDMLEATMASVSKTIGNTYDDSPRTRWADPKRKRVRVAEAWTKEGAKCYYSVFTQGGLLDRMESPYANEHDEPEDGFVFGSCFVDREGNRFGVVRRWISPQDEINKRRSKFMHLVNTRQTYGNQAIGDKNELRKQVAKPDGHVEMLGGAEYGKDFGVLPTGDMAAAQFELLQEAKMEIDAVGVNSALSGSDHRAQSGRALIQRSEQGLAELGPVFDGFKQFQLDVYRKVWNCIRKYWTAEKWVRVTDDEKNVRFVGLNQPLTLGEQLLDEVRKQGGQITPEMEQQAKMDPAMQQVVGVKNKVAELDVDIVIDDAPASASLQAEQFDALTKIAPAAATMPPPMFKALIKASNIRNKEQILKELEGQGEGKENPQLTAMQQQLGQMQQALQEAQMALQKQTMATQEKALQVQARDLQLQAAEMAARQPDPAAEQAVEEIQKELTRLQHDRELFEKDKRIALLEIKVGAVTAAHAETRVNNATNNFRSAEADLAATVQEASRAQQTTAEAPSA